MLRIGDLWSLVKCHAVHGPLSAKTTHSWSTIAKKVSNWPRRPSPVAAQLCVDLPGRQMRNRWPIFVVRPASLIALWSAFSLLHAPLVKAEDRDTKLLSGTAAMGDWTRDAPGARRKITVKDLPAPSSNVFAINRARVVERPEGAQPQVPTGFTIELYAAG